MNTQRTIIGVLGISFLLIGIYLALTNHGTSHSLSGVLVKVGLMLCATWLAFPSLLKTESQRSLKFGMLLVGMLFLVAMRPRILIVAMVVGVVAWGVNWGLKEIAKSQQP